MFHCFYATFYCLGIDDWKLEGNEILGSYFTFNLFAILFSIIYVLIRDTRFIKIDSRQIEFKNWLTGNRKVYLFDDLDGFVTLYENSKVKQIRIIYLVKDNRLFGKISEFYYSNFDELNIGVDKLKHLGNQSNGNLKSIKVFLGMRIKLE